MRGNFTEYEQTSPIHILEYEAVFKALENLAPLLRDTCVRLWCENTVVVQGLRK